MRELDFTLKSDFKDITIADYYKLKGVTDVFEVLAVLTDQHIDVIREIPINVITELIKEIEFIKDQPGQIEDFNMNQLIECGDFKLKVNSDIGNWTSGRFIDFMELVKDDNAFEDQIHLAVALCTDRFDKKSKWLGMKEVDNSVNYVGRDIISDSETIERHVSIPVALTITSFFLTTLEGTSDDIAGYSEYIKTVMKTTSKVEKMLIDHLTKVTFTQTGDGTSG